MSKHRNFARGGWNRTELWEVYRPRAPVFVVAPDVAERLRARSEEIDGAPVLLLRPGKAQEALWNQPAWALARDLEYVGTQNAK